MSDMQEFIDRGYFPVIIQDSTVVFIKTSYEYQVIVGTQETPDAWRSSLNRAGTDGWELVTFTPLLDIAWNAIPVNATIDTLKARITQLHPETNFVSIYKRRIVTIGPQITEYRRLLAQGQWPPEQDRINVNTATIDELIELPGIGNVLAQRIIDGRPYTKESDLLNVSGIGPTLLSRIQGLISF